MNWPALTPECSQAIAEVLKDVVAQRPKNLFEHVANQLQEKSGLNPAEFEEHFERCKRKPRVYILEETCPPDEDPLSWVPMRYNDETILRKIESAGFELLTEVLSQEPVAYGQTLFDRAVVAYPELSYLRGSPLELTASQTLRVFHLCIAGGSIDNSFEDDDPNLSFRNEVLFNCARTYLIPTLSTEVAVKLASLEAILVCLLLRLLGAHPPFAERFGGTASVQAPEKVALAACEHFSQALPSFTRLPKSSRDLITATLQAHFSLSQLMTGELLAAQLLPLKEQVLPTRHGLSFFLGVVTFEHLVTSRTEHLLIEAADVLRLTLQTLPGIDKHPVSRSYELYLRKRAERHEWRLMRDDYMHRAIIRLCCLTNSEDTLLWTDIQKAVEALPETAQEALKMELGAKDGVAAVPGYSLHGGSSFMEIALANPNLGVAPAVQMLARILEAADETFGQLQNLFFRLNIEALLPKARDHTGGVPLKDLPFVLEQRGNQDIVLKF
jgi:hypothetical protein